MPSELKVDKLSPYAGTTLTIGDSGDKITLASGVNFFTGDKTDTTYNTEVGTAFGASNGQITTQADGVIPLRINRLTSDGTLIEFRKDGTNVGFISSTASGMSIYLGGTAAANELDDYEEGTWTPTYEPDSGAFTSITYDGVTGGTYTKIGNTVCVRFRIRTDALDKGAASGAVRIGGLPFNFYNDINDQAVGSCLSQSFVSSANHPSACRGLYNTDTLSLFIQPDTSDWVQIDIDDFSTAGVNKNDIYGSITYQTG